MTDVTAAAGASACGNGRMAVVRGCFTFVRWGISPTDKNIAWALGTCALAAVDGIGCAGAGCSAGGAEIFLGGIPLVRRFFGA